MDEKGFIIMKSFSQFIYTCDKDLIKSLVRSGLKHIQNKEIDGKVFYVFVRDDEKIKNIDFSSVDALNYFTSNRLDF